MNSQKLCHKSPQPEVLRKHPGFAQGLGFAEGENPPLGHVRVLFNVAELIIGADVGFEFPEELVHAVEFRALFGQPDQNDVQRPGQFPAASGGVPGAFIQEQPDLPSRISPVQESKELLKVVLAHAWAAGGDAVARARIESAPQDGFSVLATDGNPGLLAAQ